MITKMKILTWKYEKYYHNTKNMKIIKKYWKYSSRGRKVGRERGRPQTRYLNLNRTRTHPRSVQSRSKTSPITTCRTNRRPCRPPLSNPSIPPRTTWPDGSGRWDNRTAAQHLPQYLGGLAVDKRTRSNERIV